MPLQGPEQATAPRNGTTEQELSWVVPYLWVGAIVLVIWLSLLGKFA